MIHESTIVRNQTVENKIWNLEREGWWCPKGNVKGKAMRMSLGSTGPANAKNTT